jgi:hypothetical protein
MPATPVSQTLELGPLTHASTPGANRRAAACPVQRAYPWLLVASTALAAVFCGLYLNKPVILAADGGPSAVAAPAAALAMVPAAPKPPDEMLMPRGGQLPGDTKKPVAADPRRLGSAGASGEHTFEETNLRIQHVLKAQGPGGEDLGKIMLEVPVLYRSRALRWTPEEVARARDLMVRISNYQEASRMIRDEGQKLLGEWNDLIGGSIPAPVLRADSPSLSSEMPAGGEPLDSTEAIEIKDR